MRVYQTNEIKNIALLGSAGSGKTTLAESMLFEAGVIKRKGSVEAKNTVSDYFPVELEYGYSVFPTVFHVEWNNKKLNIIDCPGSDDFVGGAITSLNVTDQAVILINGQYGPEVGTQNNFRYTEKLGKPVIFLVNQLDSDKCDFDNIIATMKDIYGSKCVQIQYPIETGSGFNALIDVLLMKKYSWKPEGGAPIIEDIPEEEMEKAMELHTALVEAAAENDEGLMDPDSIVKLLENKVVLIVPEGSDKDITSFEDVATDKVGMIGLGEPGSVPVGQYSEEIFTSLGILDTVKTKANYGSDVRTVLSWVETGAVDCGVVYATDAYVGENIQIVCEAPVGSCKQVIYPVGIVKASEHADAAAEFLAYLQTDHAMQKFEGYGFSAAE